MTTGRVLQFDHIRGYGFVAADDGGEDVFLHASVFDEDSDKLAPGMRVEFKVMAGDRGRKAFAARLIDDEPDGEAAGAPRPVAHPRPVPAPPGPGAPAPASPVTARTSPVPAAPRPDGAPVSADDPARDVLSAAEFAAELTEMLIAAVPELTGHQILQIRQNMLEFAKKHGWSDG